MKNKIISISVVVILLAIVIIACKSGKLDLFSNEKHSVNEIGNSTLSSGNSNSEKYEKHTLDKMIMLHKGDEGVYENIITNQKGKIENTSLRYRFKLVDYSISKRKPEGIEMNYYKREEEQFDADGTFTDDTYYVTVTFEATNLQEQEWENNGFYPQNFSIGQYNEDGYIAKGEPRQNILVDCPKVGTHTYIDQGKTATITNYYCVKEAILSQGNIAVEANVMSQSKAINTPYFILEFDEVLE